MSVETNPNQTTEPESYDFDLYLQGTGAAAPTFLNSTNTALYKGVSIVRTGAGAWTLTFGQDPGPNFLGGAFGFGDPTATNVLGWSICFGAFTKQAGAVKATMLITVGNGANAATDLAATSNVKLFLRFKMAGPRI